MKLVLAFTFGAYSHTTEILVFKRIQGLQWSSLDKERYDEFVSSALIDFQDEIIAFCEKQLKDQ